MIIGCTGNYRKSEYFNIIIYINSFLAKHGIRCMVSSDLYNSDDINKVDIGDDFEIVDFSELEKACDVILCIGGDGTFLSTVRRLKNINIPLAGIHIGGLGFLAQIAKEDLEQSLLSIINKNYHIEERMRIELSLKDQDDSKCFIALNDIVVDHGKSGRMLKTKINIDKEYLNTYESDGMIISTSIGSTAYSLSAGGPIVHPAMDTLIITPICPHSLSARSIVLNGEKTVYMEFPDLYEGISCTIDGQERFLIGDSSQLKIKKSEENIKIIMFPFYNYFETLRSKMRWSGNLR